MASFPPVSSFLLLWFFAQLFNGKITSGNSAFELNGTVFRLEKLHDRFNIGGLKNIIGLSKTTFINSENVTVERHFKDKMVVTETAEFEFSKTLNQLHYVKFEGTTVEDSIPYLTRVSLKLKAGLAAAFNSQSSLGKTKQHRVKRKTVFKINVWTSIPPCTEMEVTPLVKMVEDYEMNYRVLLKIRGSNSVGEILRTENILHILERTQVNLLPSQHNREGNFTVVAETRAKLRANFGLWTEVSKMEIPIHNCNQ